MVIYITKICHLPTWEFIIDKKNFVHSSSVILNDDCYILAGKIALDVSYHISFNTCKKNKILFISLSLSFLVVIPRHIYIQDA